MDTTAKLAPNARPGRRVNRLLVAALLLAGVGFVDSAYLFTLALPGSSKFCRGDCDVVNQSVYSRIAGIPVSAVGMVGYALLGIGLVAALRLQDPARRRAIAGLVAAAAAGLVFSAYLTYIELFVIEAICPYCVISAVAILMITLLSGLALVSLVREGASAAVVPAT